MFNIYDKIGYSWLIVDFEKKSCLAHAIVFHEFNDEEIASSSAVAIAGGRNVLTMSLQH